MQTITITPEDLEILNYLVDTSLKANGVKNVRTIVGFMDRVEKQLKTNNENTTITHPEMNS